MKHIQDYLSERDEVLKDIIQKTGTPFQWLASEEKDVYLSLLESIVSQQLSIKAADTIFKRFLSLFENQYPSPAELLNTSPLALRAAGLSAQKAGYLKNIAEFSIQKDLSYAYLSGLTDEEVIKHLIEIKGVGKWTIEMLLIFTLGREDVFPIDDLVIRNTMARLYQIESKGKELYKDLNNIAEQWKPYRSIACRYLWKWKDGAF